MEKDKENENIELYAQEIESKLLSLIIKHNDVAQMVFPRLEVLDFSEPKNKQLYKAIYELVSKNTNVSLETIIDVIKHDNSKEYYDIDEEYVNLTNTLCFDKESWKNFVTIIKKASVKKQIDSICQHMIEEKLSIANYSEKMQEFLNEVNKKSSLLNDESSPSIIEIIKRLQFSNEKKDQSFKLLTGFETIDNEIEIRHGEITTIAGAPGTGKSAMALNICHAILQANYTEEIENNNKDVILYFSLEMTGEQLIERMISINAGEKYVTGGTVTPNIARAMGLVSSYNEKLIIESKQSISVEGMKAKITEEQSKHTVRLVIIDHINIISRPHKNDVAEQTYIANAIMHMAKENNIAFIVLSQVNKSDGNYGVKKFEQESVPGFPLMTTNKFTPQQSNELTMGSIKGSSALSDNSALVVMIYDELNKKIQGGGKIVNFSVVKNRHGPTGKKYLLSFYGNRSTFYDLEDKKD